MTDVFNLLSLPQTSNAFTSLAISTSLVVGPSPGEPLSAAPRKIPRLAADSDSASAFRSRSVPTGAQSGEKIIVRLSGPAIKSPADNGDADFALATRCVRVLLAKRTNEVLPATYEQIYAACQAVVTVYNRSEALFQNVKIELERCVGRLAQELVNEPKDGVEWLEAFNQSCAWFEKQIGLLQPLLTYLDRLYITERKHQPDIKRLAYDLFTERILAHIDIVNRMQNAIKVWVEWERKDRAEHPRRDLIPQLIKHLQLHSAYTRLFEIFYIERTSDFFKNESAVQAEALKGNSRAFLEHCRARQLEERKRAQELLPEESVADVVDTTNRALLVGRLDWLANDALGKLLDSKAEDNLANMYRLFAAVDGLKVLCAAFKADVQSTVKAIVKDVANDEEMVPRLLEFKAFADKLLDTAFILPSAASTPSTSTARPARNMDFAYALIDAFAVGFKARRNKPAEMIAKYLDRAMRKGQGVKKDVEFQAELDAALGLYRFTDDKDVFRTFYHRALAKRLLLERSASDDFEKAMLKKLKENYDPEFGMGDHMFNDLALSRERMREFNEFREAKRGEAVTHKLSVMVLQRSVWPFQARKNDVDLPYSMQANLNEYASYYKSKHQGHKLDWDHSLGTANVAAHFKAGPKELTVSLYQAVVLLLFNENTTLPYADIKAQTRLEDAELKRTLQSLACGKKRVLRKQPLGKNVEDTDVFHFNLDFTDSRFQVHINSIQAKETTEENKRTQTAIEGDRKHALDAAIVRVMKAKKELHYEQLKTATIDAVRNHFVPEVSAIKSRIQGLVEQEYLRRDEDDMNLYIYVA